MGRCPNAINVGSNTYVCSCHGADNIVIPIGHGHGRVLCKGATAVNSFSWICDCHPGVRWGLKDWEQVYTGPYPFNKNAK